MSLCRTPVQIKTAKARKIDGKNAVESASIKAIAESMEGRYAPSVKAIIKDNREKLALQKMGALDETMLQFEKLKKGDWTAFKGMISALDNVRIYSVY